MIGGTSTGGYGARSHLKINTDPLSLIAIMLGRLHMTVDECLTAYVALSRYIFEEQRWPFDWQFNVRPRYNSKKLEDAIKHIVFHKTGDQDAVMMESTDPWCKM